MFFDFMFTQLPQSCFTKTRAIYGMTEWISIGGPECSIDRETFATKSQSIWVFLSIESESGVEPSHKTEPNSNHF